MGLVRFLLITSHVGSALAVAGAVLECPNDGHVGTAPNDRIDYFEYYERWNAKHRKRGLEGFRDRKYGGRGDTYNEMKEKAVRFKRKYFGENLKDGDIIYESACGEGFNLLLTLEILEEELGIKNITAYGNDYLQESVDIAQQVFDTEGRKGTFCRGDSTDLSFVPEATFDLTYIGCIDPQADPLHLADDDVSTDDRYELSRERCRSGDPEVQKLAVAEQRAQEEWHAKFVKELIRIAKPGKPVIIEDVAYPLCDDKGTDDWGGIAVEWWHKAVAKYGWDVEPDSVEVVLKPWYWNRYNVVMRRKQPRESQGAEEL